MTGLIVLLVLMLFIAYTVVGRLKENADKGFRIFEIKKGHHYSHEKDTLWPLRWRSSLAPKKLIFSFIFGDGVNEEADEDDINKLYGMSFGFDHHYRSVRIGWRFSETLNVIELFTYWYENGKRYHKPLASVVQYEEIKCTMYHDNDSAVIVLLQDRFGMQLASAWVPMSNASTWLRFRLFPYFGGNQSAPQTMKIFVREE